MMINPKAITIRAKKLGVLIRDARQAAGKTRKECAEAIGVSTGTFGSYERGVKSPSLPELEVLAFFLNVPLEHFWGSEALSEKPPPTSNLDVGGLIAARQRDIGARLEQARHEAGLSAKELAQKAGLPSSRVRAYERGQRPIPFPELEALARVLGLSIRSLAKHEGPVGDWLVTNEAIQQFLELPPTLQDFVCKPINRPYLELAQRLSEMPVEKLRAVAEGLLEITL